MDDSNSVIRPFLLDYDFAAIQIQEASRLTHIFWHSVHYLADFGLAVFS